jgi:hypothetical protein
MAQAQTLTDIANLALNAMGEGVIQNIEEDGDREIIIRRALSEIIRQVQLIIHWPELIKVSTPGKASGMFDSTRYRYNLPSVALEVVKVLDGNGYDVVEWEIIENKLVTATDGITIHYKRSSEEPSEWSARMAEVIYRKLALECCMQITQNAALYQTLERRYELASKEAFSKTRSRNRNYKKNRNTFGYNQLRRGRYINKPIGYR